MNQPEEGKVFDPLEIESESDVSSSPRKTGLAWLALLIALAAAAGSAALWWFDWQGDSERSDQAARLASLQAAQTDMQAMILDLEARLAEAERGDPGAQLSGLQQAVGLLEQTVARFESEFDDGLAARQSTAAALFELEQALAAIETTLAAVTARGDTPAQRLDMYEVESLLRLASERLQLFADIDAADEALGLADDRLAAMPDPVYLPVRQRIARARQSLSELELPDPVRVEGRIAALQSGVPGLPFPGERVVEDGVDETPPEGLWARFKHAMAGLVTVRRKAPVDDALLTIGDKDYLRQGLWLQLETARLAVMRRDSMSYQAALKRASETLTRFFDANAPQVRAAGDEIRSLGEVRMTPEMPDISGPWRQLSRLRATVPAVETEPEAPGRDSEEHAEAGLVAEEPADGDMDG